MTRIMHRHAAGFQGEQPMIIHGNCLGIKDEAPDEWVREHTTREFDEAVEEFRTEVAGPRDTIETSGNERDGYVMVATCEHGDSRLRVEVFVGTEADDDAHLLIQRMTEIGQGFGREEPVLVPSAFMEFLTALGVEV